MSAPSVPSIYHEPVRWGDVDPVAITRFDAYLRFVEIGEDEMWRSSALSIPELRARFDVWLPRKLLHIDYDRPSKLGDRLTLVTYLSRLGTTGCTLHVDVMNHDATLLHAAAHLVLVSVTCAGFEKVALPAELRAMMAPLVVSVEEARRLARAPAP